MSSSAYVEQQYVEALVADGISASGADSLSLNDQATVAAVHTGAAADALSLTDQATVSAVHVLAAADTLTLTDRVVTEILVGTAVDTLTLTSQATRLLVAQRSAADTLSELSQQSTLNIRASRQVADALSLSDAADVAVTRGQFTEDIVSLSDTARANVTRGLFAEDTLHLRDRVGSGLILAAAVDTLQTTFPIYDPAAHQWTTSYLGLQDKATAAIIHGTPSVGHDTFSLSERAVGVVVHPGAIDCSVTETLDLIESARVAQWPAYRTPTAAADTLQLGEMADAVVVKTVRDRLTLTQLAAVSVVRALAVSDSLALGEAVTFVLESRANLFQYHPFIGTGVPGAPTPPPVTLVATSDQEAPANTFLYPPDSPFSDTLTLRSPEFGNKDRLQFNRISRETRGGTLVVYADPIWPKVQVQVLTFTALTQAQSRSLLAFLAAHVGEEVGFIDWEQRRWRGVVTNPTDAVVQDGRDRYTASVELEGALATSGR